MKEKKIFWVGIFLLLFSTVTLQALQTTSRVDGNVKDPSGAMVPLAEVTLTNIDTNVTMKTTANENGFFLFPLVPSGNYNLSVEKTGFRRSMVGNIKVDVSVPLTVNVSLEIGQLAEEVVIVSDQGQLLVNTINAEVNTVVERQQIQDLPLAGRSPTELALLQAGVTSRSGTREASVNGMRGTFNNFTLDGINNQDTYIRSDAFFGTIPLKESFIQEFDMTTSNSNADGGIGASQTKMITRSGTNQYRGSVFYHHQNTALDANDFFNNASGIPRPTNLDHQFGGNIGGRVIKDKLFFFFDYEKQKSPGAASVVRTVFTDTARNGLFRYTGTNGQAGSVNLLQLGGVAADPIIKKLIDMTPAGNDNSAGDGLNTTGFRFNSPLKTDSEWVVTKIDYIPSARHSFEGVFHQFRYENPNDVNNGNDSVFPGLPGAGQKSIRRLATIAWRSPLTQTLSNELRWGLQYYDVPFYTEEAFASGYRLTIPLIDNPVQNFLPQGRRAPVYELFDNATWIKGNHILRFGGGARYTTVDSYADNGSMPTYDVEFNDTGNVNPLETTMFPGGIGSNDFTTAGSMLALLGGYVNTATQFFDVESQTSGFVKGAIERRILKQRFYNWYFTDNWRIRPNLSLTAGVRWEYHGLPYEKNGLALLPEGGIDSVLNPNAVINFVGGKTGRRIFDRDLNNFAPNVGFAWQPFRSDKTVIRGGYSMNYVNDSYFTSVTNAFIGNDGLSQQVTEDGISGTLSSGGRVAVTVPTFKVPRTARDNILLDTTAALYTIDPKLDVPYVQQWNFGIQHQLSPNLALEVRYVGNRGVKLLRAIDINQMGFPAAFVEDFKRAQRNLAANGNPRVGETLTVIPNLGYGSGYVTSSTVRTYLAQNEIAEYVSFLAQNRSFFFAGEGGEDFGATIPVSYFYKNPNAYVGDYLGNNSYSSYHGLQAEIRRRFTNGLSFQANYTFGKVLTDFAGTTNNFSGLMDNAQPQLEKMRPDYDVTHTFNINYVYQLPFGSGQRFLSGHSVLSQVIGGWAANGIVRVRSGEVVNIVSQRGTINRRGRSSKNTVDLLGMSIGQLQEKTGVYKTSAGRVMLFAPELIGSNGRASTTYFQNPGLLKAGTLGLSPISGPWFSQFDFGLFKNTNLVGEKVKLQIRLEVFNIFNKTNFNVTRQGASDTDSLGLFNTHSINSTTFGLINDTFMARNMQVGVKLLF